MSNSNYSSDGVVNKSKDEISVFFVVQVFHHHISNHVCYLNVFLGLVAKEMSGNPHGCTYCVTYHPESTSDRMSDQSEKVIFRQFVSEQVMSDSSNSTNCVMSNSDYSSDGVVDKSKDEVAVFVVEFE